MKAVIMAGGKGTRIASVNAEVPKPMIQILGKPILEYQLENLKAQGITDIILVVGHLKQVIQNYFGDGTRISPCTSRPFGVNISYIEENEPLGTAGALYYLKNSLTDDFLLLCGDIIFDIDIKRFYTFHKQHGAYATIFTHPNSHPYDSGIIIADEKGCVHNWLHKEDARTWYKNRVNAGIHIISPNLLSNFTAPIKKDLDRDILKPLISEHQLYCYDSPEYVKDMGTPDRFYSVIEDIKSGRVHAKNLHNKQKAIFLDRDGTINTYTGFLTAPEQLTLLPGAAEAIRKINESGYLAIVITNQPVIARGDCTIEELNIIHQKLETMLGKEGAYLDGIYYCPHHPEKGFPGERPEYKIECNCRKPKPGLILEAVQHFNIDIQSSWMIGDSLTDIKCGKNAGCQSAGVGETLLREKDTDFPVFNSLLECIQHILPE